MSYDQKNFNRVAKPQRGLAVFCERNGNDVCVVPARVAEPRFMRDDEYLDEGLNSIYRDKLRRTYIQLPLLDATATSQHLSDIYTKAVDLGLVVERCTFIAATYAVSSESDQYAQNVLSSAKQISERDALQAINALAGDHSWNLLSELDNGLIGCRIMVGQSDPRRVKAMSAFCNVLLLQHRYATTEVFKLVRDHHLRREIIKPMVSKLNVLARPVVDLGGMVAR